MQFVVDCDRREHDEITTRYIEQTAFVVTVVERKDNSVANLPIRQTS